MNDASQPSNASDDSPAQPAPFHELFVAFLQDPSQEKFVPMREMYINSAVYMPYGEALGSIIKHVEAEDWQKAESTAKDCSALYALSPNFHLIASLIYKQLGDTEASELEYFVHRCLLKAIVESGEGTEESPFIVTQTSDEYDLLNELDLKPLSQKLVETEDGRYIDKITCEKTTVHFDISDAYRWLMRQQPPGSLDTPPSEN